MVDIETISIIVAAVSVIIGVVYYAIELRHQNRTRDTDLVTSLYAIQNSREFQEAYSKLMSLDFIDYNDFVNKNGSIMSNTPLAVDLRIVLNFYEQLGVLYHRRLVDIRLVVDLFSIRRPWEKARPIVMGVRDELNQRDTYEWFECLYNEVQKKAIDQ